MCAFFFKYTQTMIIQHFIHSDFFNTLNEMQHFSCLQSHKKKFLI